MGGKKREVQRMGWRRAEQVGRGEDGLRGR